MNNPYFSSSGSPLFLQSFVCYADILGYKNLSLEAISNGKGLEFISSLKKSLSKEYKSIRDYAKTDLDTKSFYATKVYTDNLVIGYPVFSFKEDKCEPEFGDIVSIISKYQTFLAINGFFVRGGISFGEHFMDEDIVFGKALLDAYELDTHNDPPKITFSQDVVKMIYKQIEDYGPKSESPHFCEVLIDSDGTHFLNYLDTIFSDFPDEGIYLDILSGHKRAIESNLEKYVDNQKVREKYLWAAHYHNFVCIDFYNSVPKTIPPAADDIVIKAYKDAYKLIDYLIDIQPLDYSFRRISSK